MSPYQKLVDRIASTEIGGRYASKIAPYVDRLLFKLTKGRITSGIGTSYGKSILLLTCKGAKSVVEREVPLLTTKHGDIFIIIASQGGQEKHPAWYFNVKKYPQVKVTF